MTRYPHLVIRPYKTRPYTFKLVRKRGKRRGKTKIVHCRGRRYPLIFKPYYYVEKQAGGEKSR